MAEPTEPTPPPCRHDSEHLRIDTYHAQWHDDVVRTCLRCGQVTRYTAAQSPRVVIATPLLFSSGTTGLKLTLPPVGYVDQP